MIHRDPHLRAARQRAIPRATDTLRKGMPFVSAMWKGVVLGTYKGHVFAIKHMPNGGIPCDYKVVPLGSVRVVKGRATAPPSAEMSKRRIAASWKRAD